MEKGEMLINIEQLLVDHANALTDNYILAAKLNACNKALIKSKKANKRLAMGIYILTGVTWLTIHKLNKSHNKIKKLEEEIDNYEFEQEISKLDFEGEAYD